MGDIANIPASAVSTSAVTDSGLTATRVPFSDTGGLLKDDAFFKYIPGAEVGTSNAGLYTPAIIGGTTSGGVLGLESTTHATKGVIYFTDQAKFRFDEAAGKLTIGTASTTGVGLVGVAISGATPEATSISTANSAITAFVGTNQYGVVVRDATNHAELALGSDGTTMLVRSPTSNAVGLQVGTTTQLKVTTAGTTLLGSLVLPLVTKTSAYPLTAADYMCLADATSAAVTITLPDATTCSGRVYKIKRINVPGNNVTVASAGGTIDGATTAVLSAQWQCLSFQSDGTNWFVC